MQPSRMLAAPPRSSIISVPGGGGSTSSRLTPCYRQCVLRQAHEAAGVFLHVCTDMMPEIIVSVRTAPTVVWRVKLEKWENDMSMLSDG